MGVKGAKDPKAQNKWNKFIALLVEAAGLPHTALVRLCFITADGQTYELQNLEDLQSISKQYGTINTDGDRSTTSLQIAIEVLALNISDYRMRFKYEQEQFLKEAQNENTEDRLPQFVLSPLITTNAVIQKSYKKRASSSVSPAIDIMDMLHVNQSQSDQVQSV